MCPFEFCETFCVVARCWTHWREPTSERGTFAKAWASEGCHDATMASTVLFICGKNLGQPLETTWQVVDIVNSRSMSCLVLRWFALLNSGSNVRPVKR